MSVEREETPTALPVVKSPVFRVVNTKQINCSRLCSNVKKTVV